MSTFDYLTFAGAVPAGPMAISAAPKKKPPELGILIMSDRQAASPAPGVPWVDPIGSLFVYQQVDLTSALLSASVATANPPWATQLGFWGSLAAAPVWTQLLSVSGNSGNSNNPISTPTAGHDLLLICKLFSGPIFNLVFFIPNSLTITDDAGNLFTLVGNTAILDGAGRGTQILTFHAQNVIALVGDVLHVVQNSGDVVGMNFALFDLALQQVKPLGNMPLAGMG